MSAHLARVSLDLDVRLGAHSGYVSPCKIHPSYFVAFLAGCTVEDLAARVLAELSTAFETKRHHVMSEMAKQAAGTSVPTAPVPMLPPNLAAAAAAAAASTATPSATTPTGFLPAVSGAVEPLVAALPPPMLLVGSSIEQESTTTSNNVNAPSSPKQPVGGRAGPTGGPVSTMSEDEAADMTLLDFCDPSRSKFRAMLLADLEDEFRLFHYLTPFLNVPLQFITLCPAAITTEQKLALLHTYYDLDESVARMCFGSPNITVDEIMAHLRMSRKQQLPSSLVSHQVENLKRIARVLTNVNAQEVPDPTTTCTQYLERFYYLNSGLAVQYVSLVFSWQQNFDLRLHRILTMSNEALWSAAHNLLSLVAPGRLSLHVPDSFYSALADFHRACARREGTLSPAMVAIARVASAVIAKRSLKYWFTEVESKMATVPPGDVSTALRTVRTLVGGLSVAATQARDTFLQCIEHTHSVIWTANQ
eukprot:PhM_4_TR14565/c0_g2_i1/m.45596